MFPCVVRCAFSLRIGLRIPFCICIHMCICT
jgi:hypothetical protein